MKPSERVSELTEAKIKEVRPLFEKAKPDGLSAIDEFTMGTSAMLDSLARVLDEQHELAERRRAVWRALWAGQLLAENIQVNVDENREMLNGACRRAGLSFRSTNEDPGDLCDFIDEAICEGLL